MPHRSNPISRFVDWNVFSRTIEFAGTFRDGIHCTKPLSIRIRYSPINAHRPTGVILGTVAQYPDLELFFMRKSHPFSTLTSVSSAEGREVVRSEHALLREITGRRWPPEETGVIQQVLGRFELDEFSTEHRFESGDKSRRVMAFFLAGPSSMWLSDTVRQFSALGSVKAWSFRARLRLPSAQDVQVFVRPNFIAADQHAAKFLTDPCETTSGPAETRPPMQVEARAFALTIEDKEHERSDKEFRDRALTIAETLCLVVSFLSKADVTWYHSTLHTSDLILETCRSVEARSGRDEYWWDDAVIQIENVRLFIARAFTAYQEQARNGVVLRLPILLYVASSMAPTIDERLILLFRAFEMTLDPLDHAQLEAPLLSHKELASLRTLIRSHLNRTGKPALVTRLVGDKVGELRRPPLMHRAARHLRNLKVELADIGGEAGLRRVLDMRNRLLHASGEPPIEAMVAERKRIETIVERLMLRLLGWRSRHRTPTTANRSIIEGDH